MDKIVKIDVWIPNRESLQKIATTANLSIECGSPRSGENGLSIVTFYGVLAEAKKIMKLGFKYEIDEKFGEMLLQRQKEVSKVDRFKGGKKKPVGLGTKK